jgi:Leucine-rich repeat (LRR) protein
LKITQVKELDTSHFEPFTTYAGGLVRLDLAFNTLNGTIPAELGNLTALELLFLQANGLEGSIPKELGNLTNLKELLLYDNQLTDSILKKLGNLEYLNLGDNKLRGSIPPELGNLTSLPYLYLYDNRLSGPLPKSLVNLTNLQELDSNRTDLCLPTVVYTVLQNSQVYIDSDRTCASEPPAELPTTGSGSLHTTSLLLMGSGVICTLIGGQLRRDYKHTRRVKE